MEKELSEEMVESIIKEAEYYSEAREAALKAKEEHETFSYDDYTVEKLALRSGVSERTFQLDTNTVEGMRLEQAIKQKVELLARERSLASGKAKLELSKEMIKCRGLINVVREVKEKVQKQGTIKGGKIGKRGLSYDLDHMANVEIEGYGVNVNDESYKAYYSLKGLEKKYGIPSSTLYDGFTKHLDPAKTQEIEDIFEYNKAKGKRKK